MKARYFIMGAALCLMAVCCAPSSKDEGNPDGKQTGKEVLAEGEASEAMDAAFGNFLKAMQGVNIHGVVITRHGKILEEQYFKGWSADSAHHLWSSSKSFTSLAVGYAIEDNLLSLDTKMSEIFPEETAEAAKSYTNETLKGYMMNGTIEDYLVMACGHPSDATFDLKNAYKASSSDLYEVSKKCEEGGHNMLLDFFKICIFRREPGTTYVYDSISSYVLSAAVQKVTGKKTIDYLYEKFFSKIGVEKPRWDEVQGINCGGWGLYLTPRDMAKAGLAMANCKKYYGEQFVPKDYLKKATTARWTFTTSGTAEQRRWQTNGYGYQFWMNSDAYFTKGMEGQYIYVLPQYDAVMTATGKIPNDDITTELLWKYIIPVFDEEL